MNRSRAISAFAAAALSASLLAGCSNSEDEVRIAEPVLDFPQTSTTATPTPEVTTEAEETEETETTTSETETEESTTTSTSTRTSTSSARSRSAVTRTRTSGGGSNSGGNANREPAPAAAPVEPDQPGAACAWPTQSGSDAGQEYSTFCNREWARTVTPNNSQDYYWVARGTGWVSVDPAGAKDGAPCWNRTEFAEAPEAIRNAVTYCEAETSTTAAVE